MKKTRVLVVDDSSFLRRSISSILDADDHLEVIGTASNGAEAITLVERLSPDVVTMDIEMPVMDGITAAREIMQRKPTPILIFSSLSTAGAKATLDALDAGAVDYMPKTLSDVAGDVSAAKRLLCARVRTIGARGLHVDGGVPAAKQSQGVEGGKQGAIPSVNLANYKILVIGTSTGGPAALQELLPALPADFPLPIIIVQHMPESFTLPFADRLNALCRIRVKQGENGDRVLPGQAIIAPGGQQMLIEDGGGFLKIKIQRSNHEQTYKPSVDITFNSIADKYPGKILAVVLTGMGADGCEGARNIKQHGSTVWAQDKASSVVYGMPMVVAKEGIADHIMSLSQIKETLQSGV